MAVVVVLTWLTAVAMGLQRIWAYETTAGQAFASPRYWPGSDLVAPQLGKATLMMFVHPRCTCTQASLLEMQGIVAQTTKPVAVWILVVKPHGTHDDWNGNFAAKALEQIPNAHLITDEDGAEAQRFGAATSGHVVLYDEAGSLLFSGGITERRGHAGDNASSRAVLAAVNAGAADASQHAVLGCGLFHRDSPGS